MSLAKKVSGTMMATAAAAVFAGCVHNNENPDLATSAQEAKVKCQGINSCNGSSDCRSPTSSCSGRNECAGSGWLYIESIEACEAKNGTVI